MKPGLIWLLLIYCVLIISMPGIGSWLESSMLLHVLVQLPLLVFLGWLAGECLPSSWQKSLNSANQQGIAGVLLISGTALFWMLPSALDASLNSIFFQ